jgi:HPt (histidine-containing phosphotransfer) domain-containing protein
MLIELVDRLGKRTERARMRKTADTVTPKTAAKQGSSSDRNNEFRRLGREAPAIADQALHPLQERDALVDRTRLAQLEDIARNPSFLGELISGFTADVVMILEKAHHCTSASETDDLPDLMHALKGAAVGLGASKLAAQAAELESCADTLSALELQPKLKALDACFAATSIYLKNYLQLNHHAPR